MAGWWSGGRLQGDLVAERLELADEVAGLAGGVDAAGVVVGAQVVEAGGGVGEQVPDDHQDGAGDGDQGLELADAFHEAPVGGLAHEWMVLGNSMAHDTSCPGVGNWAMSSPSSVMMTFAVRRLIP